MVDGKFILGKESILMEKKQNMPSVAPGIDDDEELERSASKQEREKGEFTKVTKLSYDEVDPS